MSSKWKTLLFSCLSTCIGLAAVALMGELFLRLLPVDEGFHAQPVNQANPILHYEPNRTARWSRFWNFALSNIIRTNNYGFLSNIDYQAELTTPLIAVIGDSFVEAAMLPWEQTGAARLQEFLGSTARLYSFGISGAPLSQYLKYAEFIGQEFSPDRLVVLVVGNDFDESLLKYKDMPGFHYFKENSHNEFTLHRVDYHVSLFRKLARKSTLFMYLARNINLLDFNIADLFKSKEDSNHFVGNTSAEVFPQRLIDSQRAVDAFLSMLPTLSNLDSSEIVLVIDGIRPQLYDQYELELTQGSYYDRMRRYFITQAKERNFEIVDMQPIFRQHYEKYGKRFEFPNDAHWNPLGHELFARAVLQSQVMLHFIRNLP